MHLHLLFLLCLLTGLPACLGAESRPFITREGDRLMEGDHEFRFASFNHPNLHISENPVWRRTDAWEQEDAIRSIAQMGGRVVRIYTLSVRGGSRNGRGLSHVYSPGVYDEELLRDYDRMIALCARHGVRLIIPFLDEWDWFGGIGEFAAFRGRDKADFYADPAVQQDFRELVRRLLTRVNTVTGVAYRDDPTIMAWESGNELAADPEPWVSSLAAYVRELAPRQLFMDGHCGPRPGPLADPCVDIVSNHYYRNHDYAAAARRDRDLSRGRKPFCVGEFDPRYMGGLLDEVIANGTAGILAWSLRGHAREGGFLCHTDPLYYHWPYSEVTRAMRRAAFAIRGLPEPSPAAPLAPALLPVRNSRAISWLGSAGADSYRLERAAAPEGPWVLVADGLSDDKPSGCPLYADQAAPAQGPCWYRLQAANAGGRSPFSEPRRREE
jgi:hypothetical protein